MAELGFEFTAMGGGGEIRLEGDGPAGMQRAARAAIDEVRRIEAKYSRYDRASAIGRLNASAGSGQPHPIDAETGGLLDFAERLHAISGGRFDITAGALRQAWDFDGGTVPDAERLAGALAKVGAHRLRRTPDSLALPLAGMEIDLGGIAKEYACDRAAARLLEDGMSHGWISLAGDIRVLGPRSDGSAWRFGIQHPRRPDAMLESVDLAGGALATSGDYERWFEQDGRRYCHLLDARTGWPVDAWQSVSVVAPTCSAAGAVSTLACLLAGEGLAFLHAQPVSFIAVDALGEVHRAGIAAATPFEPMTCSRRFS